MNLPEPLQPLDEYNRILGQAVHPEDWQPPTPASKYNLVVIGAGTAGLVTAAGAAGLGAKVALIERSLMGGDCLNVGCVPSKGLIAAANAFASARAAERYGLHRQLEPEVEFAAVMRRMRRLRAGISHVDSAQRFRDLGVDVFFGEASFIDSETVAIGELRLRFKRAVIATGARAAELPIPGLADINPLTNESLFSLEDLPKRMAIVGGGPIGCEMAQSFSRFGSEVTLLEKSQNILSREDQDAALIVQKSLENDGVRINTTTDVTKFKLTDQGKEVWIRSGENDSNFVVDHVLIGIGRQPNVEGLNLDRVGVVYDSREGVQVNDRLQTTNPKIYAAGDVCSRYKFTHAADFMARIVIQNTLFMGRRKASQLTIPWCTYTSPELAHVGLNEQEAQRQGVELQTFRQDFNEVDRAILEETTEGFIKVHTQAGKDKILGATIVHPHAGDLISPVTVAMTNQVGLSKIANTIHPYPTMADAFRRIGDQFNRTRLTPRVQALFRSWLAWQRR